MKWLYAHAYYTEDEFWNIYDRKWYDALRVKYHATSLPSVYDKVKIDINAQKKRSVSGIWAIWPLSGLYGVAKVVVGSNYLLPTKGRDLQSLGLLLGVLVVFVNVVVVLLYQMAQRVRA